MSQEDWKSDIIYWDKISNDTAALMLNQCETGLKETVETAKLISLRAERLILIISPTISALIIYVFQGGTSVITSYLSITAILAILVLSIALLYGYRAFRQYEIAIPGEYPENIVVSKFIDNDLSKEQQYLTVLLNICENIQRKIDRNNDSNSVRSKNIKISMESLILLIPIPFISWLLYLVLLGCHCGFE